MFANLLAGGREQVKGEQEAIDFINERAKPLAAYVFASKKEVEQRMVASISAGGMVVNDTVLHVSSQADSVTSQPYILDDLI